MKASILAELTIFRERNMKPNFSKLASENGMDRRTVKKYYENPSPVRKRQEHHSYLEKHDSVIRDKVSIPGMTYAGIHSYLVHELGIRCTYPALTWYCRRKEYHLCGIIIAFDPVTYNRSRYQEHSADFTFGFSCLDIFEDRHSIFLGILVVSLMRP